MNKTFSNALVALCAVAGSMFAASSLDAASVDSVIVRQQWPWSTDVKVEYILSGVDRSNPVDLKVTAYDGDTPLDSSRLQDAIIGDIYGITSAFGELTIDPTVAFNSDKIAMRNFRVKIETVDSADNMLETLYKIYCLTNGVCTDVSRADLLNGKYGAIETSYSAFGDNVTTPLTDVIIWTDVTNDVKYATTHLVMRRIPAKNLTFTMGSPVEETGRLDTYSGGLKDENGNAVKELNNKNELVTVPATYSGRETQHEVSFTNDFYIGVFEVTQYQYYLATKTWPSKHSYSECRDSRPVDNVCYDEIRGTTSGVGGTWPTNRTHEVLSTSFLGKFRNLIDGSPKFDLPTEAQWEYACRAKNADAWYHGGNPADKYYFNKPMKLSMIARYNMNGGYVALGTDKNNNPTGISASNEQLLTLGTTNGTARVGSYVPNAYGLYDMLGNVKEWCLDWFGMFDENPVTDPAGPTKRDSSMGPYGYNQRSLRGSSYRNSHHESRAAMRDCITWSVKSSDYGLRLCLTVEE